MSTRTDADTPKPAASSITIADWSGNRGRGATDAARTSPMRGSSLIELVLKEITDALGRGDTVQLSTAKPDPVSRREMVFRPKPPVSNEMAEPAQHAIRRNFADPSLKTENYDVV